MLREDIINYMREDLGIDVLLGYTLDQAGLDSLEMVDLKQSLEERFGRVLDGICWDKDTLFDEIIEEILILKYPD